MRLLPNESVWLTPLRHHLGELALSLVDAGINYGISVDLDSSDRTRPGEQRGGASPIEGIALVVAGLAGRELLRLVDRLFDAAVDWALRHRRRDPQVDPVVITIYGPDGNVLKDVLVHPGDSELGVESR